MVVMGTHGKDLGQFYNHGHARAACRLAAPANNGSTCGPPLRSTYSLLGRRLVKLDRSLTGNMPFSMPQRTACERRSTFILT